VQELPNSYQKDRTGEGKSEPFQRKSGIGVPGVQPKLSLSMVRTPWQTVKAED